ncbi:MAG: class II glutamine amidotransferase [Acidimicrobiales bacterium]|nr:MAG: class II glutamine amidotransferase [Acidimicrobiales bacterium]
MLLYLGRPRPLSSLLFDPPHSLERQASAPRYQDPPLCNGDGWGVCWYPSGAIEPRRHRTTVPIWEDEAFHSSARSIESGCVLAAVRSATPPSAVSEENTPPYTHRRWAFAHNGRIQGFHSGTRRRVRELGSPMCGTRVRGSTDSEWIFAILLERLQRGDPVEEALSSLVRELLETCGGAFTTLLTDGEYGWASVLGRSLFYSQSAHDCVIASEPLDDEGGWTRLPEGSLLAAREGKIRVIEGVFPT